jgi:dipeptidyl aminopeptidase/acylaminoacyl peptidase
MESKSLLKILVVAAFIGQGLPCASPTAAGEHQTPRKKRLTVEDLYLLESPSSPALAPDGKRLAYIRQWIDGESKRQRHALWLVEGNSARAKPVERGQPDTRASVFSPDGKWIAVVSTRPRPKDWKLTPPVPAASDPAADIWLIPTKGGPAIPLAGPDKPYGRVFHDAFYGRVAFSPDGRRLVFVADDGKDPRSAEEIEADVTVVRPDQGEGYTGYGPAQVWVAHLDEQPGKSAASRIERLTQDDVWYGDPHWSPDGKHVVVHANKTNDREAVRYTINKNYDLWLIDVKTRKTTQLTFGPGPEVSPRFSPDGKRLACLSVPRKGSHHDVFNLLIITLGDSGVRSRVVFDHQGPQPEKPPHPAPSFPLPEDCWDGAGHLVYGTETGVENSLARVDLKTGKGSALKVPSSEQGVKPSAHTAIRRRQQIRQLMPAGNLFLRERLLGEAKSIHWKNGEGMTIEGLLTLPPEGAGKPPYKLVLHPHGGPHGRSVRGFDFTVQVLAAQGYAVFQPNFRGSVGYGQKFIDADRFDFGGGDMRDILTGIDHLVREKIIDPDRQFVYGVSYGGFMTCWLPGQTNQFRAAVAQNAVTDLNAMWGLSDIQSWTKWEFGGRPWEVPAAMRKHSPLTHASKIRTPMLILHSRDDRRCPLPMGMMFYKALLARKVPTQMVIYPNEGHGIRQPRHRVDVLRRTLAWFRKYDRK